MHRRHGKHSTRGCGLENSGSSGRHGRDDDEMGDMCVVAVDSVVQCSAVQCSAYVECPRIIDRFGTSLSTEACMRTGKR